MLVDFTTPQPKHIILMQPSLDGSSGGVCSLRLNLSGHPHAVSNVEGLDKLILGAH